MVEIPFSRAILRILLSTLIISGSAFMGWLYFLHVRELRIHDDQYRIVAIIQSTPQPNPLKTFYLAELLDLSLDHPLNLYQFNATKGRQTLLANPLIKQAEIKKITPGTLYIQYQMRTPIAFLGEFSNTAIDEEGYLFPFRPFFTPKRLPIFFLGLDKHECRWGSCLTNEPSFKLATEIANQFEQLHQERWMIKQLDVAQAKSDSYGQRQIVLVLESGNALPELFLRLNAEHPAKGLVNFRTLQANMPAPKGAQVIDLRIPHLAFIKGL